VEAQQAAFSVGAEAKTQLTGRLSLRRYHPGPHEIWSMDRTGLITCAHQIGREEKIHAQQN
jgi:hypothetical protein